MWPPKYRTAALFPSLTEGDGVFVCGVIPVERLDESSDLLCRPGLKSFWICLIFKSNSTKLVSESKNKKRSLINRSRGVNTLKQSSEYKQDQQRDTDKDTKEHRDLIHKAGQLDTGDTNKDR